MKTFTLKKLMPLSLALLSGASFAQSQDKADLMIWNGTIYTANAKQEVVEAVAIKDDRIVFVGDKQAAKQWVGKDTELVDIAGKMALPGLHDVHIHPVMALEKMTCELPDRNQFQLEQVVDHIQQCLKDLGDEAPAPGGWITVAQFNGYGADSPAYLGKYKTLREGLNDISTEHNIFLSGADGHVYGVNDYALEHGATLNGKPQVINADTLNGELVSYKEYYQLDDKGVPTGLVKDSGAYDLFDYEKESAASLIARADDFNRYFHAAGITSAQDAWNDERARDVLTELMQENELQLRLNLALKVSRDEYVDDNGLLKQEQMISDFINIRKQFSSVERLNVSGVKLMVDGVIEYPTQTAAMKDHYLHARAAKDGQLSYSVKRADCSVKQRPCKGDRFNYGIMEFQSPDLSETVVALDRAGFTIHFHALGDGAVDGVLTAIEAARAANPSSKLPHNIAHFQQVDPVDIPRFGKAGVFITPTMSWLSPWIDYDQTVIPYIDEHDNINDVKDLYRQDSNYMQKLYPIKSIKDGGAIVSAGSDAPVDGPLPRPFTDMMYGLLRGGWVEDSNGEAYWAAFNREERLKIEDLIDSYTINGARAMRHQDITGSLEVGKKADLVIINQDIIKAAHTLGKNGPEKDVSEAAYSICDSWWGDHCKTEVEATYLDGVLVYEK